MPKRNLIRFMIFLIALGLSAPAFAEVNQSGVLDNVVSRFQEASASWSSTIIARAQFLFWSLALISMIWTFGQKAVAQADLGDILGEIIRFVVFFGLFDYLLINGPVIANAIFDSMSSMGSTASGFDKTFTPSNVLDIGFVILDKVMNNTTWLHPFDNVVAELVAIVIIVLLALVAINIALIHIALYFVAYAGIFILGFGGSRWTSDIAINYFKSVFGIALSMMGMILVVGVGLKILNDFYASSGSNSIQDDVAMIVIAVMLYVLSNKVPALLSGMVTGASAGGAAGLASASASSLRSAAVAGAAAVTGGAALAASGAANAAGVMEAAKAASAAGAEESGSGALASAVSSTGAAGSANDGGSALASVMGGSEGGGGHGAPANENGDTGMTPDAGEASAGEGAADETGSGEAGGGQAGGSNAGGGAGGGSGGGSRGGSTGGAMGALVGGMKRAAQGKADSVAAAWQERVANTAGGKLAAEIRNPGAAAAAKSDAAAVAKADGIKSAAKTAVAAEGARQFLAGGEGAAMRSAMASERASVARSAAEEAAANAPDDLASANGAGTENFVGDTIMDGRSQSEAELDELTANDDEVAAFERGEKSSLDD